MAKNKKPFDLVTVKLTRNEWSQIIASIDTDKAELLKSLGTMAKLLEQTDK